MKSKHWVNTYPHMVYISVLLLDHRIENWKVGQEHWVNPLAVKAYWKIDRVKDYKVQYVGFYCKNDMEHNKVFEELSPKWLKQFKHAKDYKLQRAY